MVGYCAIAAALRLAAAMRISERNRDVSKMTRSPSLIASIIFHGVVVVSMAWWVPMKHGGMPGEGGGEAQSNALLLDAPNQAEIGELAPAQILPFPAEETEPEPESPQIADVVGPPVVASEALATLPAPSIGVQDLSLSKQEKKSAKPPGHSRRSSAGLSGSRSGGGGGNGSYVPPRYARCPAAPYPPAARTAHIAGLTLLRVSVSAEGTVVRVALLHSSGNAALDNAALATVRTWRFVPAQLDKTPVEAEVEVPVRFVL